EVLAVRLDDDRHLAPALVAADLDGAGNLRHDRRLFGLAGLKDFSDAGQTSGDILSACEFSRPAGQELTGDNLLLLGDFDTGLGGQVVVFNDLAIGVFDDDLRILVAAVFDHDVLGILSFSFGTDGLAFDDVLQPDETAGFGQDRRHVRIPAA